MKSQTSAIDMFRKTLQGKTEPISYRNQRMPHKTTANWQPTKINTPYTDSTSSVDKGRSHNNTATFKPLIQYKSASNLHKIVDRGATSSLLSVEKPNTVTPYYNQLNDVKYTEDGQLVSHSVIDSFNKKLILNENPKTLQEELNIPKRTTSASMSKLSVKAKISM